jgi:hypothetical protein
VLGAIAYVWPAAAAATPVPSVTGPLPATAASYVAAVARDVGELVKQHTITVPDGVRLVRDAAHADVP